MDPCGTPQEVSSKSESLFSVFPKNILSGRYYLNHFIVLSRNLIVLSFCNKISWSIVCKMSSVDQLVSFQLTNLRQTLLKFYLLRKTMIDLLNDYLQNLVDSYISSANKKAYVWSWITLSMIFENNGSNETGL